MTKETPVISKKRHLDVQLNLRVDEALKGKLDNLVEARYTTLSGIMREAILDLLDKYAKEGN
jgi:predicted transcriptional regulator